MFYSYKVTEYKLVITGRSEAKIPKTLKSFNPDPLSFLWSSLTSSVMMWLLLCCLCGGRNSENTS